MDNPTVIDVAPDGDVILEGTFKTSKETLKEARKAAAAPRLGQKKAEQTQTPPPPVLKATVKRRYRVQLDVLKQNSSYFTSLLTDTRFAEARTVEAAFKELSLKDIKPSEADPTDLPVVELGEDDEASRSAGQETTFEDFLRILHRKPILTKPITMHYLATIALLADKYLCTALVSQWLNVIKYKWPDTKPRSPAASASSKDDGPALTQSSEDILRQKILVSWLLNQPPRFAASTRELIMYGSRKWVAVQVAEEQEESEETNIPSSRWWDLPAGLEEELYTRRDCILSSIASIQRHFLSLYTTRTKTQCQRGYENSISCDAFQLGEMIRFFSARGLLFMVDFSSSSYDSIKDFGTIDVNHIIAILKQCPGYQIDKNHTNCGLRTRLMPILEYVEARLFSSSAIAISRSAWETDRQATAWKPREDDTDKNKQKKKKLFSFNRSTYADQRVRYGGTMGTDSIAREFFTADEWDWTPVEQQGIQDGFGNWRFGSPTAFKPQ